MKRYSLPVLVFAIAVVAWNSFKPDAPKHSGQALSGQICTATDGDTLRCGDMRVRLLGIDTAELPGHCRQGRDCAPGDPYAQKAVLEQFAGEPLTITPVKTDRYGRTVAIVTNPRGENASCVMLGAGARYMPQWDDRYKTIGSECNAGSPP